MTEPFSDMLAVGGKKNSLGRVNDVIREVLNDKSRLEELYTCIFDEDAWVRMRAIDGFEKICREHPGWIKPYITRIQNELADSTQASIQWHIAQIYAQVELNDSQKEKAIRWLEKILSTQEADWIAASNSMETLAYFARNGDVSRSDVIETVAIQRGHKSNAVIKRAKKILSEFS